MLRADTTHSYITKPEIIRLRNYDPSCAFINSYLRLKYLRCWLIILFFFCMELISMCCNISQTFVLKVKGFSSKIQLENLTAFSRKM